MREKIKRFGAAIKKRRALLIAALVLAAGGVGAAFYFGQKANANDYITAKVERTNVEVTVSATGTVQAVTTVQVGSQVSGTVQWLGADFNTQVKQGQVIAKLDPAIFQAQVDNATANVQNARAAIQAAKTEVTNQKANLSAAKANLQAARVDLRDKQDLVKRNEDLAKKGVLSPRDLEAVQAQANVASARVEQATAQVGQVEAANAAAEAKVKQAEATLAQAEAQLSQAKANLDHTIITSPIDGVVVSRNVDVGQTVAASLQAPTLFTIANDLTKMQVLASIDEADVGQIRQGIKANFTVDAFPGEVFSGEITQLRLNAQTQQNVVTYTAVIDVANPELKLRPGMTANITVPVDKRENVLAIPNAALRFKPNLSEKEQQELREKMEARRKEREAQQGAQEGQQPGQGRQRREGQGQPGEGQAAQGGDGGQRRQGQMVWVLVGEKQIEPRFVRTGLTNGRVTEIIGGDLKEGDIVIVGQNDTSGSNRPQQPGTPFGQRPPMGGGRGR
ncbi:MAG TPA: efflux RND transporter periplasmic adaptor subunit [Blastocatellia bacterium]|nr:efflux RND transporter periplasmic adaptor subunit [Blastocatellia bacterium]